jgi:hypothetical protein
VKLVTFSLTHSLTRSLAHLLTHSLTQSLNQSLNRSPTQSLDHPLNRPFTQSLTRLITQSLTQSSLTHPNAWHSFKLVSTACYQKRTWVSREVFGSMSPPQTVCHFSLSVITLHASTTIFSLSGYYHGIIPFAANALNGSELSQMVPTMRRIKLSLYKPWRDMGEWMSAPLILNLSTAWKWSAWRHNGIITGEMTPSTHWSGGWVGSRDGLNATESKKSPAHVGNRTTIHRWSSP